MNGSERSGPGRQRLGHRGGQVLDLQLLGGRGLRSLRQRGPLQGSPWPGSQGSRGPGPGGVVLRVNRAGGEKGSGEIWVSG